MVTMKKIIVLAITLIMLFSLSSCYVTVDKKIKLGEDAKSITSIDIYDTGDFDGYILDIREDLSPIYTIEEDDVSAFVGELTALEYKKDILISPVAIDYAHVFSSGLVVVIEYDNGGCDIYAEKGILVHTMNSDGVISYEYDHADYRGSTPWDKFIEKYIDTEQKQGSEAK